MYAYGDGMSCMLNFRSQCGPQAKKFAHPWPKPKGQEDEEAVTKIMRIPSTLHSQCNSICKLVYWYPFLCILNAKQILQIKYDFMF